MHVCVCARARVRVRVRSAQIISPRRRRASLLPPSPTDRLTRSVEGGDRYLGDDSGPIEPGNENRNSYFLTEDDVALKDKETYRVQRCVCSGMGEGGQLQVQVPWCGCVFG